MTLENKTENLPKWLRLWNELTRQTKEKGGKKDE